MTKTKKHKYFEIESYVNEHALTDAINAFCERALVSQRNIISILNDIDLHEKLISFSLIKLITHQSQEWYQVDWNHHLAFGVYNYLLTHLKLKKPENSQELIKVDNLLSDFRESDQKYRMGRIQLVTLARRFLLIEANHIYGENLKEYLNHHYENTLFDASYAIKKAIGYLKLSPIDIENLFFVKSNDVTIGDTMLSELNQMFREDKEFAYNCFNHFVLSSNINLLSHLYAVLYDEYDDAAVLKNEKPLEAILFASVLIKIKSKSDFEVILNRTIENSFTHPILATRSLASLIKSEFSIIHENLILESLFEILKNSTENVFANCLYFLGGFKNHVNKIDSIIIKLFHDDSEKLYPYLSTLDNYITGTDREESNIDFLLKIFEYLNDRNQVHAFRSQISRLRRDEYSVLISKMLNHEVTFIHLLYREVELIRLAKYEILNSDYINTLTFNDIKFIVNKIIAHVNGHENLSSMLFSLLSFEKNIDEVDELVSEVFFMYVLFNYRGPISYLENKIDSGTDREKSVAKDILEKDNAFRGDSSNLPLLKELMLPSEVFSKFQKLRMEEINKINSDRPKTPSLMDLITKVDLRAGKRFMFRREDGTYSISDGLSEISHSVEIPQGDFLDPIGQKIIRIRAFNYKR